MRGSCNDNSGGGWTSFQLLLEAMVLGQASDLEDYNEFGRCRKAFGVGKKTVIEERMCSRNCFGGRSGNVGYHRFARALHAVLDNVNLLSLGC